MPNFEKQNSVVTKRAGKQRQKKKQIRKKTSKNRSEKSKIIHKVSKIEEKIENIQIAEYKKQEKPDITQRIEDWYTELAELIQSEGIPPGFGTLEIGSTQYDYAEWAEQYLAKRQKDESSWTEEGFPTDSQRDCEARNFLQRGFTAGNGQQIQGAIEQSGPSCRPTALQAGLTILGWDTRPYAAILQNFPEHLEVPLTSLDRRSQHALRKAIPKKDRKNVTNIDLLDDELPVEYIFAAESDTKIRKYGERIIRNAAGGKRDPDVLTSIAVKGLTWSLMDRKKKRRHEADPAARSEIDHELKAGEALLQAMCEMFQTVDSMIVSARRRDGKYATMPELKDTLRDAIRTIGTPMYVSVPTVEFDEETGDYYDDDSRHRIIITAVDRNPTTGGTSLKIRDSNDDPGEEQTVPINEFLHIIYSREMKRRTTREHTGDIIDDTNDFIAFSPVPLTDGKKNRLKPIDTAGWVSPRDILDEREKKVARCTDKHKQAVTQRELAIEKLRSIIATTTAGLDSIRQHTNQYAKTEFKSLENQYVDERTARTNELAQLVVGEYLTRIRSRKNTNRN